MPPTRRNRRSQKLTIQASTATVMDLNEYCLMDVFDYLSPLDMCSVVDTCQHFRKVATSYMHKFYQSNELIVSDQQRSTFKFLCKFGAALTKLRIELSNHRERKAVYSTIRKLSPKLDSLTLSDTYFESALELCPLLGNLRKIRFEYRNFDKSCSILYRSDIRSEEEIKALLKACTNVEEISFGAKENRMGKRYQGIFLQQKFKKLLSLEIIEVRDFDVNNLKLFLKLNPNVRRLSLKRCVALYQLIDSNLLQYAPNLEAIALKFSEPDYYNYQNTSLPIADMLSQLENMKCLALDTCRMDITKFIASMAERNALTYLSLGNVKLKINEGLERALSNLTNLRILRLHIDSFPAPADFISLCKPLVNLEEFHLRGTTVTLKQIADIIKNSDNLKKFYFRLDFPMMRQVALLDEYINGTFLPLQSRKKTAFPLTLYFESSHRITQVMALIPTKLSPNVIQISEFVLCDFDDYAIPRSVL